MRDEPVLLAAIGDAENPNTWSGIPAHFLQGARAENIAIAGMRFDVDAARTPMAKALWTLGRLSRLGLPRGLQYSERFLTALWKTAKAPPSSAILLNMSQLFPRFVYEDRNVRLAFFTDQTLLQLFEYYDHGRVTARDIQRDAIAREKAQYQRAVAIILQSRWAADSVINDYGIDPARVHVVIPGANIDQSVLNGWDAAHPEPRLVRSGPLRLGFVGKDWQRKGLDRLIRSVTLARAQGGDVELHVIGPDPATMPAALREATGVEWVGFVDKRNAPDRFLSLVDGFDVGCLLSQREAGGISLLEFARLGIPTLAPATGGAPEYVVPGASTLIAPEADDPTIAAAILALATDDAAFSRQRKAAWAARHSADWRRSARELASILAGLK